MEKLMSLNEFEKLGLSKITNLLETETKTKLPKGVTGRYVLEIAKSRLHGICFINDDEELTNGKISKKSVKISKTYENCPQCSQKSYIVQPFAVATGKKGSKWCEVCGFTDTANKLKEKEIK